MSPAVPHRPFQSTASAQSEPCAQRWCRSPGTLNVQWLPGPPRDPRASRRVSTSRPRPPRCVRSSLGLPPARGPCLHCAASRSGSPDACRPQKLRSGPLDRPRRSGVPSDPLPLPVTKDQVGPRDRLGTALSTRIAPTARSVCCGQGGGGPHRTARRGATTSTSPGCSTRCGRRSASPDSSSGPRATPTATQVPGISERRATI